MLAADGEHIPFIHSHRFYTGTVIAQTFQHIIHHFPGNRGRVADIYRSLLTEERRHSHAPEAMAASAHMLQGMLEDRGQTYDEFVWSLANPKGALR